MPFAEPITTLTDYALAVVGLAFAVGIGRRIGPRNRVSAWLFCAALLAAGVAALTGGTFHGFGPQLGAASRRALWNVTVFAMGAVGAFVTAAVHAAHVRRGDGTVAWLAAGIAVTLAGAAIQQGLLPYPAALNRNAAYHLIQIAGLYALFRCAQTVRDRPGAPPDAAAEP